MGVYIKDMEMPKVGNETIVRIQPDGTILDQYGHHLAITAISVPAHGRLGDLGKLAKEVNRFCDQYDAGIISTSTWANGILHALFNAPTVIPAEENK